MDEAHEIIESPREKPTDWIPGEEEEEEEERSNQESVEYS